jgi:hypothetical protein
MSDRIPGPVCQGDRPQHVDAGTMCRAPSPLPGHVGQEWTGLEQALAALQSQAELFAWRFIHDAKARAAYVRRIAEAAAEIRRDVQAGRMSAAEGARLANEARNLIMNEVRAITSAVGRAGAEGTKAAGLTLDEALDKAVKKLFPGRGLADLTASQRRQVFEEVIEASGRSSPKVTARIPKWYRFGRGLAVVTVAISVYNIWEAQNKLRQGVKEGSTLLGGALGGAAANASAGFLCGPGAPVCVTVLFVVGGVAGALIAQSAADYVLDQKEVVSWLGE